MKAKGEISQIDINLDGIGHAISDSTLAVPLHQRSYAWEDRHVTELFQDLATAMRSGEPEYFLGSIVIIQQSDDRAEVVDGQQRLATITILLSAIRDYFYKSGDTDRASQIEQTYLVTRDLRTQEPIPKLRLNETDHEFFSNTVLTRPDDSSRKIPPSKDSHRRIAKASELAEEHVERIIQMSRTPAGSLIDWVDYVESGACIIWVRVPDDANAFTIFETLNDRGLDLAITDLLKNYLFHLAGDRIQEVQQRWVAMFSTLEAVDNEAIVIHFLRHLWSSKYGLTRERELYSAIRNKITSKQAAIDFASDLTNNARTYAAILNTDHAIWVKYGPTARGHMSTLNDMGMIQIRPLLLAALEKFSDAEVKKTLRLLISWAVRFLIVGGVGGGTLERHYSERAVDIKTGKIKSAKELLKAMSGVVPADTQFQSAFSVATISKSRLARYYLQALEKQARGEKDPEFVPNLNQEEINLEHVLPLNPSRHWKHLDTESAKANCRRLGNMALIKARANVKGGNDSFTRKRAVYKNSTFQFTKSISKYKAWTAREIADRQRKLATYAVKTWPNKA